MPEANTDTETNTYSQDASDNSPGDRRASAPQLMAGETEGFDPKARDKDKKIGVIEIFGPTIQGEGPLAGSKTLFVRFAGCDYRCKKCDSLHAVIPTAIKKHAQRLTEEEIVAQLLKLQGDSGTHWVTFSGGNPLMWDLDKLMTLCSENGLAVAVETQGTLYKPWLSRAQIVVISPKSPGMGEKFEPEKLVKILGLLRAHNVQTAIKVVIFSALDIEFALFVEEVTSEQANGIQLIHPGLMFLSLGNPYPPVLNEELDLVDPPELEDMREHNVDLRGALLTDYRILAEEICQDGRVIHWRFLPQLHVLAWANETGK